MNFLIDYNLRGQAELLWGTIAAEGWLELMPIRFVGFEEVGLLANSSDRLLWQTAQTARMIILTANRNMKGEDSLEQIIRQENTILRTIWEWVGFIFLKSIASLNHCRTIL